MNQELVTTMSLTYARTHFCAVVRRVEAEETIILLKRNVPVARMVPIPRDKNNGKSK